MLYIVEVPYRGRVSAWCAKDKADAIDSIKAKHPNKPDLIFKQAVLKDLVAEYGYEFDETDRMLEDENDFLVDLINAYDPDTVLHWDCFEEEWCSDEIDEFTVMLEYNGASLFRQIVFQDNSKAIAALQNDALWQQFNGRQAQNELGELLRTNGLI